jgi:hypothetical protein
VLIGRIRITNFRCLKRIDLHIDPLTALLGRNGVGKSSILHALECFYNPVAPITPQDFFDEDTSSPIEIALEYVDLDANQIEEFTPFVARGVLSVVKRIGGGQDRFTQGYFASLLQFPAFATIRQNPTLRERTAAWNELVAQGTFPELVRVRRASDIDEQTERFEAAHPDLLEPFETEVNFFAPGADPGRLDRHTKFLLVPAVKDVAQELTGGRGSSLPQLIDLIVLRRIEARQDISERRTEIQGLVRELYQPGNLPELRQLADDITSLLSGFSPGARLILDWDEPILPDLPLPSARTRLVEDDFEGDIDKKGHGLQRALLITLLQYLAQVPKEPPLPPSDTPPLERRAATPTLILAIEEPELYLHPLRARYLAQLLSSLTQADARTGRYSSQVIFSSHSPLFVDISRFQTIRIIRKQRQSPDEPPSSTASFLAVQAALQRLAEAAMLPPDQVTPESFRAHILPVMGPAASEGFFADAIVLVEGPGDAGIIAGLQEVLSRGWVSGGIAVVPVHSKNSLDRPFIIFSGLGIPTYLVFDGDKDHQGSDRGTQTKSTNRRLLRLLGEPEVDFPPTRVTPRWACFGFNMEHELSSALTAEVFMDLRERIASELGFRPSQVLKSPYCSSAFLQRAYSEGHRVPVLEELVEMASRLPPAGTLHDVGGR